MPDNRAQYSRKPVTQQIVGVALTVLINVLLYLMVDGLFAIDLSVSGGRVLS
jgi:hypothetical protein